ncbi:uncharacterized protein LOC113500712 [Trichoplusia ni]|uniref:Uncharacterized protein LOC113500451 n=1 Tax=Trichoplusia ni TaxID=7111 RepID=A0A7E5WB32_TRINI|nr:uncharacterized protein LOC113500451 [Trichoplusia ni]XP_026737396.1 uncharacterized protein LOC113500712 [Trichoplusia ni]
MDWSNDKVLKFIELLKEEPAIWDRNRASNNNRQETIDAWERIQAQFSVEYSVEELKRKRNCLMTAYRDYLRKIKESSSNFEDVYKPTWFAFDALHSFLGSMYEMDIQLLEPTTKRRKRERWLSRDYDIMNQQAESETSQQSEYSQDSSRKRRNSQESHFIAKNRISDIPFQREKPAPLEPSEGNEYDLYGQLLAEKLKKMQDADRLMVMNEIDNLVFKYAVNARSRKDNQSVDTIAFITPSHPSYLKASGTGSINKKKMKLLASQIKDANCGSNEMSSDDD